MSRSKFVAAIRKSTNDFFTPEIFRVLMPGYVWRIFTFAWKYFMHIDRQDCVRTSYSEKCVTVPGMTKAPRRYLPLFVPLFSIERGRGTSQKEYRELFNAYMEIQLQTFCWKVCLYSLFRGRKNHDMRPDNPVSILTEHGCIKISKVIAFFISPGHHPSLVSFLSISNPTL